MTKLLYPPPYQDLATLAQHICAGETTIENWVAMGQFPAAKKKIGGKRLWSWAEVSRFIEGQQDPSADIIGRITNAARREALRSDQQRGVRKRDQSVPGVAEVPQPCPIDPDELPVHAPAG